MPPRSSKSAAGPVDRFTLLGGLLSAVQAATPARQDVTPPSVGEWAVQSAIKLDRGPFSFHRHEYLEQPYSDNHPYQVEMKCAQMGNTIRALLRMFHAGRFMPFVGLMYLFPSKKGSADFSRSRVSPLIETNPEALGQFITDTDSVELKRMCGKNLIYRGTRSTEGLRSDPVDLIVYDEFDLFNPGVDAVARERMAHSDHGWEHYLSNPTMPDFGIDVKFSQTDQGYWLLKCEKCGQYTCLEDTFPDCLHETNDGRTIRLCMSCRDRELHPGRGLWVPKKPGVTDKRGYHYSQLFSQYVSPADILEQYRTTTNMAAFMNYKLGLPYIEAENRLSKEQVFKLCGSTGIASSDPGPCYMGVDQGKGLHVVISKRHPNRIVHLGEYKDWGELDRLMEAFHVRRAVVDAMPETRNARELASKPEHKGRVFLNYYSIHAKGGPAWNEDKLTVTCGRTESLSGSHDMLAEGLVTLPKRCQAVEEFALHAHNTAKKLNEEEDGSKRYVWVKLGPDHYRHAWNYCCLAMGATDSGHFSDWGLR